MTHSGGEANRTSVRGDSTLRKRARPYLRFAAMIVTGMVVMYWTMFAGTWDLDHVRFSESRVFMTLTMGGTMVLVMFAWMVGMYKNTRANVAVVLIGAALIVGGVSLDRSQVTVDDTAYMSGMIPHHSLAITRSERAQLADVRVCELAASISETQREEIEQMAWLIDDIRANGPAETAVEARERSAPSFSGTAERMCPSPQEEEARVVR